MARFAALLDATLNREMALHREFAAECGITAEELAATEAAPTTRAYTSHLVRVASLGDLAETVTALLPCQWGYAEIGQTLARRGKPADAPFLRQMDRDVRVRRVRLPGRLAARPARQPMPGKPTPSGWSRSSVAVRATSTCSGTWPTAWRSGRSEAAGRLTRWVEPVKTGTPLEPAHEVRTGEHTCWTVTFTKGPPCTAKGPFFTVLSVPRRTTARSASLAWKDRAR